MSVPAEQTKGTVREALLTARRARTEDQRTAAAEALVQHAMGLAPLLRARRVAAYLSMPSEPGTGPLLAWLVGRGVEVIVPISRADRSLGWVSYAAGDTVVGDLGVPEPSGAPLPGSPLASCDLVLVPALAVDHVGHRLGRGAGYYDRALADVDRPVCAVVFDDELVPSLPHEPHDHPVDLVLTPAGVFRPDRG